MNKNDFPSLTGVRAIAAFLVVIHHVFKDASTNQYINSIIRELNIGVNMFFVLSGFLIWYNYSPKFKFSKTWIRSYIVKRIARIYPTYFILTTISMVFVYFFHNKGIIETIVIYFLNISFLNGYSSIFIYTGIPQGWTLNVEVLFYIIFPIIIYFNSKKSTKLYVFGVIMPLLGLILYSIFNSINFFGFFNKLNYIYVTTLFGRFFEFLMGIYLAKYLDKFYLKKIPFKIYTFIGAALIIITATLILPSLQNSVEVYSIQTFWGYIFNTVVLPFFIATFYFGLITEKTYLKDILSSKMFKTLGKSSYSLYLFHDGIIILYISSFLGKTAITNFLLSYIISLLIWKIIEEPSNKLIRNLNGIK